MQSGAINCNLVQGLRRQRNRGRLDVGWPFNGFDSAGRLPERQRAGALQSAARLRGDVKEPLRPLGAEGAQLGALGRSVTRGRRGFLFVTEGI